MRLLRVVGLLLPLFFSSLSWSSSVFYDADDMPHTVGFRELVYTGASMVTQVVDGETVVSLSTSNGAAVWFGDSNGHFTPYGDLASGTYFKMRAKLSSAEDSDFETYLRTPDGYSLRFRLNPAGSYTNPVRQGVELLHKDGDAFFGVDLSSAFVDFEVLFYEGLIHYWVGGTLAFSGTALHTPGVVQEGLVIGDGSAATLTGEGTLHVDSILYETVPSPELVEQLLNPSSASVPVPGILWLLLPALLFARRR